jgi:hypothetical protein
MTLLSDAMYISEKPAESESAGFLMENFYSCAHLREWYARKGNVFARLEGRFAQLAGWFARHEGCFAQLGEPFAHPEIILIN